MEPHEQGAAAGYLSAANTTGAILGPIFGTGLYRLQPNAPMLVGGVLMLVIGIYALTIPAPVQAKE
jgi:MFS family permease